MFGKHHDRTFEEAVILYEDALSKSVKEFGRVVVRNVGTEDKPRFVIVTSKEEYDNYIEKGEQVW